MKLKFFIAALLLSVVTITNIQAQTADTKTEAYACPMKCEGEKTYSEKGSCPKCGMDLKAVEMKAEVFACPMKCEGEKTYSEKGDCPKCGMHLKAVEKGKDHDHNHEH